MALRRRFEGSRAPPRRSRFIKNGYSIYKTTVAPGAFEINDLYATGSAGDLYVTVKESDGSEQNFVVPFASLAVLQREGQLDYALSSGRTRSGSSDDKEYNFIPVFPGLWRHQ